MFHYYTTMLARANARRAFSRRKYGSTYRRAKFSHLSHNFLIRNFMRVCTSACNYDCVCKQQHVLLTSVSASCWADWLAS